jgi:hypothetical protein
MIARSESRRAIAFAASSGFALVVTVFLATAGVFGMVVMTAVDPVCSTGSVCTATRAWCVAGGVGQWLLVAATVVIRVAGVRKPALSPRLHWVQIGIAVLAVATIAVWGMAGGSVDAARLRVGLRLAGGLE